MANGGKLKCLKYLSDLFKTFRTNQLENLAIFGPGGHNFDFSEKLTERVP